MNLKGHPTQQNDLSTGIQLGKHRLSTISIVLLLICAIPQTISAQAKKKMPVDIAVTDTDIQSLSEKLDVFDRQLSMEELGAMNLLLMRASMAPADNPAGTDIKSSFFASGSQQDNALGRRAIVVQGGRVERAGPAGTPGGRPPIAVNPLRAALGDDTDPVSIGPKHEDPIPAPETINALDAKLRNFGGQLSPQERGIMDWLVQRAGTTEAREAARVGTPGGQPPSLSQALSRGDPNPPKSWLLHF